MQEIHARYTDKPWFAPMRGLKGVWVLLLLAAAGAAGLLWGADATIPAVYQWLLWGQWLLILALLLWLWRGRSSRLSDNSTQVLSQADNTEPDGAVEEETTTGVMTQTEQEMLRYTISHDLRAPLRVIDGFARILKEEEGPRMDRMSNDHLDRLLAAAGRMNTMIDAILAQAQLTQTAIERQDIDLSALARQLAAELDAGRQSGLGASTCTPVVDWVVADAMTAQGDPDMLRRILENLMGNAVKYSSKVAHPRVEVGMVEATAPTVFFVRDNGAGFDMQHAQKLFGLFQRLHSNKEFPGSGVGLAGVQIMVRRHGGRIWAEAQPGQGACFYFTLTGPRKA